MKDILAKLKGSLKDPFLYLGALSIISFTTLSLGAGFIFKPFVSEGAFSILATVSQSFDRPSEQSLFTCVKERMETPSLNILQQNSLGQVAPVFTASFEVLGDLVGGYSLDNTDLIERAPKEIIEYTVRSEDTLKSIAEKFQISLDTLLWANDLSKKSTVIPGQKLIIPPVSGILYHVKRGDTLSEIAKTYKGNPEEIISFNELSNEQDLYVGDILIIPNGTMPAPPKPQYAAPSVPLVPLASSYFICPISSCRITQGLHWYNAIDFSTGNCGDPIYAAAGGEVIRTKYGWNNGGGNYLTISHPNGTITYYGHLQTILVKPGDSVSQGQIIGLMGGRPGTPGAGRSTGCHVHFGVQGAKNPFAK